MFDSKCVTVQYSVEIFHTFNHSGICFYVIWRSYVKFFARGACHAFESIEAKELSGKDKAVTTEHSGCISAVESLRASCYIITCLSHSAALLTAFTTEPERIRLHHLTRAFHVPDVGPSFRPMTGHENALQI